MRHNPVKPGGNLIGRVANGEWMGAVERSRVMLTSGSGADSGTREAEEAS